MEPERAKRGPKGPFLRVFIKVDVGKSAHTVNAAGDTLVLSKEFPIV